MPVSYAKKSIVLNPVASYSKKFKTPDKDLSVRSVGRGISKRKEKTMLSLLFHPHKLILPQEARCKLITSLLSCSHPVKGDAHQSRIVSHITFIAPGAKGF